MSNRYKVKDCFLLKKIIDEYVVVARGTYALEFGGTLVLNETCAFLWENLKNFCDIDELSKELATVYSIEPSIAKEDTIACIDKMIEYDLLEIES